MNLYLIYEPNTPKLHGITNTFTRQVKNEWKKKKMCNVCIHGLISKMYGNKTNTQSIHISSGPLKKSEKSETMIRNTSKIPKPKPYERRKKATYNQIKKQNTKHLKCFFLVCRFLRKEKHRERITRILTWILILNDLIFSYYSMQYMRPFLSSYINCFDFFFLLLLLLLYFSFEYFP